MSKMNRSHAWVHYFEGRTLTDRMREWIENGDPRDDMDNRVPYAVRVLTILLDAVRAEAHREALGRISLVTDDMSEIVTRVLDDLSKTQ